jgi:nitrogen fixation NifU-like protein
MTPREEPVEIDLDAFVREIREEILEETRSAYGDEAFERWETRRFMGPMENPDGCATIRGGCGDSMSVYLQFEDERVRRASFMTDGCGSSVACGSLAVEMAHGRTPDELLDITPDLIRERAGGLPVEDRHCADLAATALHEALSRYMESRVREAR